MKESSSSAEHLKLKVFPSQFRKLAVQHFEVFSLNIKICFHSKWRPLRTWKHACMKASRVHDSLDQLQILNKHPWSGPKCVLDTETYTSSIKKITFCLQKNSMKPLRNRLDCEVTSLQSRSVTNWKKTWHIFRQKITNSWDATSGEKTFTLSSSAKDFHVGIDFSWVCFLLRSVFTLWNNIKYLNLCVLT